MPYTFKLLIQMKKTTLSFKKENSLDVGYTTQITRGKNKIADGIKVKRILLATEGKTVSFVNNFMASAKGTRMPGGLFGPFRSWIYPRIFRSKRVKNAVASNTITI